MLNISIKTIPHNTQRYDTCGDYWRDKKKQYFRISEMNNKDHEFLIALHELVECYLCEKRGISEDSIDKFDIEFERNRKTGDDSEPGDSKKAPYYREHRFAETIERLVANEIGVDWFVYNDHVSKL